MKPTEEQIEEIAGRLDSGMRCFFNLKTGEIKNLINLDTCYDVEEELWAEDYKKINENPDNYFEVEVVPSYEAFQVMADFSDRIDDLRLKEKLIHALNNRKPFQNFKWQVDNSGPYRQEWYDIKNNRDIQWVKEQVEINKEIFHD